MRVQPKLELMQAASGAEETSTELGKPSSPPYSDRTSIGRKQCTKPSSNLKMSMATSRAW